MRRNKQSGSMEVVGIVSGGTYLGLPSNRFPVTYQRVSPYLHWIKKTMSDYDDYDDLIPNTSPTQASSTQASPTQASLTKASPTQASPTQTPSTTMTILSSAPQPSSTPQPTNPVAMKYSAASSPSSRHCAIACLTLLYYFLFY